MNVDVHAWTPFFKNQIEQFHLENILKEICTETEWQQMYNEIKIHISEHALVFLDKLNHDFLNLKETWIDPDLNHIQVSKVIQYTWTLLKTNHTQDLIEETLLDINTTCIQGITHRMFSLVIIFENSIPNTN